jgi:hypothetical protein
MAINEITFKIKVDKKALQKAKREIQSLRYKPSFWDSKEMLCLMFFICGTCFGYALSLIL